MDLRRHGDVAEATQASMIFGQAERKSLHGLTMAPVFPEGFRSSSKGLGEPSHPVVITCLQWDCDGALNDWDRQWMLQKLAAAESRGLVEGSLSPGGD